MSSTCRGGRGGGGVLFYKMRSISIINLFRTLLHPLTLKVSTSVILLAGSASTGLSGLVSLHVCSCNLNLIIDSVFNFSLLTSYVQQIKRGKCLVNCDRPTRRPTNQPTDGYESSNKNALQLSDFLIKIRRIKSKFVSRVYPKLLLSHILHGIAIEQLFRNSLFSKIYTEMQKNSVSVRIRRYLNAFRHKEINDSRGLEIFL